MKYFGNFSDGLDGFHSDFNKFQTLGGEIELSLIEQAGGSLDSIE